MDHPSGDSRDRRHSLSDWLTLHELDAKGCRRLLDAMTGDAVDPHVIGMPKAGYVAPDVDAAWLATAEAMRDFLPDRKDVVDAAFEGTAKIAVDQSRSSRRAMTLDNGPSAYPTIVFSYLGMPSDLLVMGHEFGHALQIVASRGKFVPPILREACAFLGEGAMLAHADRSDPARHAHIIQVWLEDNRRCFGAQRDRLRADLSRPATDYRYSWNYPIARFVALRAADRCSREWIWRLFEGELSLPEVLEDLTARSSG